jgi:hypothetical protein
MISRRSDRCVFAALTSQPGCDGSDAVRTGTRVASAAAVRSRAWRFQTRDRKLAIGTRESPPCAQGATRATCSNCVVDAPSASSPRPERCAGRGAVDPCATDSSVPISIAKRRARPSAAPKFGCFGAMLQIRHARITPVAPGFPGSELGCLANAGVSGAP